MVPFERLTGRARKAMALAHEAAEDAGADIGPEHLLLGVAREQRGLGARILTRLGVSPEELGRHLGAGPQATARGSPAGSTAGLGRVIQLAFFLAGLGRHREVGTEHLLL